MTACIEAPEPAAEAPPSQTVIGHPNDLAKVLGVSLATIKAWQKAGMPFDRGHYDLAAIIDWRAAQNPPETELANLGRHVFTLALPGYQLRIYRDSFGPGGDGEVGAKRGPTVPELVDRDAYRLGKRLGPHAEDAFLAAFEAAKVAGTLPEEGLELEWLAAVAVCGI